MRWTGAASARLQIFDLGSRPVQRQRYPIKLVKLLKAYHEMEQFENPYQSPERALSDSKVLRTFSAFNRARAVLCCFACITPFILAGCAWLKHRQMVLTGGYATNSFPWNKLASDLAWIGGICIAVVVVLWCTVFTLQRLLSTKTEN